MATTRQAGIRALLGGGTGTDRLASIHFVTGAVFLLLGGVLEVLSLLTLRFGGLLPLPYGRLHEMANLAVLIGFAVISLIGGVYYVLPRLSGARLWSDDLAGLGLVGMAGLTVLGLAAIPLGLGDGLDPLGLPWWLDLPMLGALSVPAVVTLATIASREERRSFVTVWFVIGGTIWLPLLYLTYAAADLPFLEALAVANISLFFTAGMVTLVIFTLGSGLFYYGLVRETDLPLASRQLAMVGFWSLGLGAGWWGLAQMMFGPSPAWVGGVAAALGLAFPVGALANAANASLTLEGSWERTRESPGLVPGLVGLYLGVLVALVAAVAGFRSVGAVVALTPFWDGVEYAALYGVAPLLVAGTALPALPRLLGRGIHDIDRVRSFTRLTLIGAVGVMLSLVAAGLVSGYSWVGGSNSAAYVDAGEGWGAGSGGAEALLLIGIGFATVSVLGQLAYLASVWGTVTRGRATAQEVLVPVGAADE